MSQRDSLVADAKTTDGLDELIIVPRASGVAARLANTIRHEVPSVIVRQRGGQVKVSPFEAPKLLNYSGSVDLHWTPEARLFAENRERAASSHRDTLAAVHLLQREGETEVRRLLGRDELIAGLDAHQRLNVAAMALPGSVGLCVFDEQGTGKTVTTIAAYDLLVERDEIDVALIVAPKSMVSEWSRDFARMTGDMYRLQVIEGSRKEKRAQLGAGADVLVTNFETAVGLERELEALLRRMRGRALLVVDESFFVKNLDAQRTRALRRLREWAGRAFVLCGTPAPNSATDIVEQFNLVDFGATFDGTIIPEGRDAAAKVIKAVLDTRGCFLRSLKKDVLPGLPARRFEQIIVPMTPRQETAYQAARGNLIADLREATDVEFASKITSFLARRSALLQICSHPRALIPGYNEVPAKLVALDSLLEELIERRKEKVVLWSYYTASIEAIVSRYARYGALRYDGTVVSTADRAEAVRRFQEGSEEMLFVGNPAAAGAGLTLHRARVAIFESFSNQAAHYLQSLDRIHRRGQEREVEYIVLLCDGTIEESEYSRLEDKQSASQALLGDGADVTPTRKGMLEDLLKGRSLFSAP